MLNEGFPIIGQNPFGIPGISPMEQPSLLLAAARMTPDQQALKELVEEATHGARKPLTKGEPEAVLEWAQEYNYPGWRASPEDILGEHWKGGPHIHIPRVGSGHIPVQPGVTPR